VVLVFAGVALAGPGMPKTLQAEFGQYPKSSVYQEQKSKGTTQVILNCGKASIQAVSTFYKERAMKRGWKISRQIKSGDLHQLWLSKGKQSAMIAVSFEGGSTFAVLTLFDK